MPRYEYKVVPAPKKPGKVKGVRGTEAKFAASLAELMNELGAEGWEYQRTDTLPCEERSGLTGKTTSFQNILVFRKEIKEIEEVAAQPAAAPKQLAPPPARPDFLPEPPKPQVQPQGFSEPVATFRRDARPAVSLDPEPKAPQPGTVPSFRSASAAPKGGRLTAVSEVPEGKAPAIRFRPEDTFAAQ